MKISTETRMDFGKTVGTEERFALRNWLESLIEAINYNDVGGCEGKLAQNLIVEGYYEYPMDHETYLQFLKRRSKQKVVRVIRFPELKIQFKQYNYYISGTYEEFSDGILSYEGTIEMVIGTEESVFQLLSMKFFPRLRLK